MPYHAIDFSRLLGAMGFSDEMLQTHMSLYEGYVTNTNQVAGRLNQLARDNQTGTPEYAELNRRFGWEFNGMRLHEYYFGNMIKGGTALRKDSLLFRQIENDFGSFENWRKDFVATAALRGIGWAIVYYEPAGRRLVNSWIGEHDIGHLAGASPILVLDVFEHAYLYDYGLNRRNYIESYMSVVDWDVAARRLIAAGGSEDTETLVGAPAGAVAPRAAC